MPSNEIPEYKLHRLQKTADVIQVELAKLMKRANDPRFHEITITRVELTPNFRYAKVFFTLFDESQKENTLLALKKATAFFRVKLAQAVHFRSMPKLDFAYDIASSLEQIKNLNLINKSIDD